MNFRTNDWLKKINTNPLGIQTPQNQTPNLTTLGFKNPTQQMTGRVGGIQTTAQQTQPLSAQLGGWFGQSPEKKNLQPLEALMGWLSPYLTQALSQQLAGVFGNQKPGVQPWTQALPQNITNKLLRGGRK